SCRCSPTSRCSPSTWPRRARSSPRPGPAERGKLGSRRTAHTFPWAGGGGSAMRAWILVALTALAVGVPAGYAALGAHDTNDGSGSLASEAGGDFNSAFGFDALNSNTTGTHNVAVGAYALQLSTSTSYNTVLGADALGVATAAHNTAVGFSAL